MIYLRKLFFICSLLGSILISCAYSETHDNAIELVKMLNDKLSDINTYKVDYVIEKEGIKIFQGEIEYKKPNKIKNLRRSSSNESFYSITVVDGENKWYSIPSSNVVLKESYNESQSILQQNFDIIACKQGVTLEVKYTGEDKIDNINYHVFEAKRSINMESFKHKDFTIFYLDEETALIKRVVFLNDKRQQEMLQDFGAYQVNIPIDDKEFIFNPPEDAVITDLDKQSGPLIKMKGRVEGQRVQ